MQIKLSESSIELYCQRLFFSFNKIALNFFLNREEFLISFSLVGKYFHKSGAMF